MRITKSYLEKRVERFASVAKDLKMYNPETHHVVLDGYNPGDGKRYQIQINKNDSYSVSREYPKGHYKTQRFSLYLDGMLDALESVLWENR